MFFDMKTYYRFIDYCFHFPILLLHRLTDKLNNDVLPGNTLLIQFLSHAYLHGALSSDYRL